MFDALSFPGEYQEVWLWYLNDKFETGDDVNISDGMFTVFIWNYKYSMFKNITCIRGQIFKQAV